MTDAPAAFQPVNMVERQLVAAANGDAEQQKAFERFIVDETLYVATPEAGSEGTVKLQQDTNVQVMTATLNDGRRATAIFTSPQRVAEAFGEVGYLGIKGRVLFEMVRADPAVLNPGQTLGVVWEPAAMATMLGQPTERVVQKDTQVMLGFPSDPPTDLIDRLKTAFAAVPQIEAAWLALAAWPEEKSQSWYLDVRGAEADREAIRAALPAAIEGADLKGRPMDMIINAPGGADGAGIVVIEPRRTTPPPKKGFLGRLFG